MKILYEMGAKPNPYEIEIGEEVYNAYDKITYTRNKFNEIIVVSDGATDKEISDINDEVDGIKKYNVNPNLLDNGGFMVWQRGTSFTGAGYTADRWRVANNTVGAEVKKAGQSLDPLYKGYAIIIGGNASHSSDFNIQQRIEDIRTLQGQYVTFSGRFWSSVAGKTIKIEFRQVDTDGITTIWSTTSPDRQVLGVTNGGTQDFSFTTFVPEWVTPLPQNNAHFRVLIFTEEDEKEADIVIGNCKLEIGEEATPFVNKSFQEELGKCRRYFWKPEIFNIMSYTRNLSATARYAQFIFPTKMRTAPTINIVATTSNCGAVSVQGATKDDVRFGATATATSGYFYVKSGTTFDAEY